MTPRRRWALISIAAVGTAIAAFVGPEDKEAAETVLPIDRAHAAQSAASGSSKPQSPIDTQLPVREEIGRQRGDPFAARSWAPPPKPAAQQEQAKPTAPPNPYRFAGTVMHEGHRKVFLMLGDRVIEAKEGEMLEQGFRVKSVTDSAVTLVYEQIPDQPVTIATVFSDAPAAPAAGQSAAGASTPR